MATVTLGEFESLFKEKLATMKNEGHGLYGRMAWESIKEHEFEEELRSQGILVQGGPVTSPVEQADPEDYDE